MSTIQDLQNALLDATKLLSDKSTSEAKYTYTIKCKIKGVENASLHLYTVEYGANTFNAYANNNINYKENDIVYVLVPEGDFSQQKQIIGAYAPKASMYVPEEESDIYVPITENLFGTIEDIDLQSWTDETRLINLNTGNFNLIFQDYLINNRNFKFTAKVKTEILKDYQVKGNYGLILSLPFVENAEGGSSTPVWRSYVMDVNTMQGNPYSFNEWNKIDLYYNLDESLVYDSSRQPYMTAFVSGFGYIEPRTDIPFDIHFKEVGIEMVDVLTVEDMEGYSLTVVASSGHYFLRNEYNDTKTLTPVLKVKGKTENNFNKWECYWFVEDTSIGVNSDGYLNFGGLGWKCLNKKTNITYDSTGKQNFQYVTNNYSYTVQSSNVTSTLRYKCVMVQDTVVVAGNIKLKNLNSNIEINLISATGSNTFVAETGYVSLIARIYYPTVTDQPNSAITLSTAWQRFDKNDNYLDNNFYEIIRNNDPVTITSATGQEKKVYETEIRYPCSKVEKMNTVNCTFYSTEVKSGDLIETNLGTSSIVIATSKDFIYGLAIDGGDVLYKYDSDGDSPLVANYDGPLSSRVKNINPISYRMYKADGTELTDIEYLYCKYTWSFPKNSMMKLDGYTNSQLDDLPQDDNYYYIIGYGKSNIHYTILNSYNKKKNDNTIILNVEFAGNKLSSVVTPKFLKEGQGGTNGTKYSAIINYNGYGYGERDANGKLRKLQLVYIDSEGWKIYDIENEVLINFDDPSFSIDVYMNGDKITDTSRYSIIWQMFDDANIVTSNNINVTCFGIDSNGVLNIKRNWDNSEDIFTNIICATVTIKDNSITNSNEVIYVYYPIEITRINGNDYTGKIPTLDGGFDQVVYGGDGTNPEYDNTNPFECNDSLYNDTTGYYTYNWSTSSNLRVPAGSTYQSKIAPNSKFDNGDSRNYIKVSLSMSQEQQDYITNLINELDDKIFDTQNAIKFYQHNKQYIFDFVEIFSYNKYIGILENCLNLLSYRGQGIQIIDNMFNIIEDINTYCKNNNVQIVDFDYIRYYDNGRRYLNNARTSLYKLINKGKLSDLDSLTNAIIVLKESIKDKYGVSFYFQLKSLVDSWNEQINSKYQPIYIKLKEHASGEYVLNLELTYLQEFSAELLALPQNTNLRKLTTEHDNTDPEQEFINLKDNLTAIVNKISSVDGGIITYTTIVENLLKPIDSLLNIYKNEDYQNKYYKDLDDKLNADLIEYQNQKDGYVKALLPNSINYIIHIKPIIMIYNRFEMSHLNGWDGNKLYVDERNNEYLFAPQIGAGTKENNAFTGIVMGVKKFNSNTNQQIGLFGYDRGIQSIFLNARNGSATFGKSGAGQVIIDPSSNTAIIKSGNYSTSTGTGMQIDLTTPEIRFGSGNFVVNSEGKITAKGGGTIAGWNISDTTLSSTGITIDSTGSIRGDGQGGRTWSITRGNATFNNIIANGTGQIGGWKIGETTLKSTNGDTTLNSNGTITCKELIANNAGSIGGWKIDGNQLTGGGTTLDSGGKITCANLVAQNSGKIGTWDINDKGISNGSLALRGETIVGPSFTLGNEGLSLTGGSIKFAGSTWNGNGVAFGGNASYNSTNLQPFQGKCVNHIESLAVGQITAKNVTTALLDADITTSGTITCGVITATSSSGSSIKGLSTNKLTISGHSWEGGIYRFTTADINGTTVLVPARDGGTRMLVASN